MDLGRSHYEGLTRFTWRLHSRSKAEEIVATDSGSRYAGQLIGERLNTVSGPYATGSTEQFFRTFKNPLVLALERAVERPEHGRQPACQPRRQEVEVRVPATGH